MLWFHSQQSTYYIVFIFKALLYWVESLRGIFNKWVFLPQILLYYSFIYLGNSASNSGFWQIEWLFGFLELVEWERGDNLCCVEPCGEENISSACKAVSCREPGFRPCFRNSLGDHLWNFLKGEATPLGAESEPSLEFASRGFEYHGGTQWLWCHFIDDTSVAWKVTKVRNRWNTCKILVSNKHSYKSLPKTQLSSNL